MKRILAILLPFAFLFSIVGCNLQGNDDEGQLESKIDSIQNQLSREYVPGTGEIMNNIVQPHHLKLWLAGQNKNWQLAEYERKQLLGGFKRIQIFHKDKPEATAVVMIFPAMDAMEKAIRAKNADAFKSSFAVLTNTCNTCHESLKTDFNVITVPSLTNKENQLF